MKKILLTIVGVVGLTAGSWGQVGTDGWRGNDSVPTSVTLSGYPVPHINGVYDLVTSEPEDDLNFTYWVKRGEPTILMSESNGPSFSNFSWLEISDPNAPGGSETIRETLFYDGVTLEDYPSGNQFILSSSSWAVSFEGGGFGPGYTPPTPPDNGGGTTGGVIAQAEELNIGLTFQNGQWTPTQR